MTAAAIAAVALSGCGGGGDDEGLVEAPEVSKPLSAQIDPVNKAIADQSCDELLRLDLTAVRRPGIDPGAPPSKSECDFIAKSELLASLKGIEFTKAVEYGTAGLMEGNDPRPDAPASSRAYSIWFLDSDGQFRYAATQPAEPQFDKKPPPDNNADENAEAFVQSIKHGNCDPSTINPRGSLAIQTGNPQKACDAIDEGKILAPAIRATSNPAVEKMGESLDFVFYGLATERGYFTLMLGSGTPPKGGGQSSDYTVYEEVPNTVPTPQEAKQSG
jgi:hypothetical protein